MNQKFYEKDWFLWVCLIFIAPVGIFLLWKNGKFNKKIRIALTAVFCIWFIVALATGGKTKTPQDTTTANKPEVKQTETTEKKETPKKEWKPKELAELGKPYYCYDKSKTTYDGLILALNVSEVQKKDDSIVAISHAPGYDDLKYAREKYMAISLFDSEGNSLNVKDIIINPKDENTTEIITTSSDADKAKYIQIMPYQTTNKNWLTYEIK